MLKGRGEGGGGERVVESVWWRERLVESGRGERMVEGGGREKRDREG